MIESQLADFWVCPRLDLNVWPIFRALGAVEDTCSVCLHAVVRQRSVPAGIIGPATKIICLECCAAVAVDAVEAEPAEPVDESSFSDF